MGQMLFDQFETTKPPSNVKPAMTSLVQGGHDYGVDSVPVLGGPPDNTLMTFTGHYNVGGQQVTTFYEDYYLRVYFIPSEIAFGSIAADKTVAVTMWNTFFSDITLDAAAPLVGQGVEMNEDAFPYTLGALGTQTFTFTATAEGATTIIDEYEFEFTVPANGDDYYQVPISGFRVPTLTDLVWTIAPNWAEGFTIAYEFKTDIIFAQRGNEQRRQIRQTPRKAIQFTAYTKTNERRKEFNRMVRSNQSGRFYVPEYTRFVKTTTPMLIGELSVEIDQLPPWWITDGAYVILSYNDTYAVRRIDYPGEDSNSDPQASVFFRSDDGLAWPVGTKVHPAISCWMPEELSSRMLTNYVQQVPMDFQAVPGLEPVEPDTVAPLTMGDKELWLTKPNWANTPDVTHVWNVKRLDSGYGRANQFVAQEFPKERFQFTYTGRTFAECETLRQFFYRCRGRAKSFYTPTWQEDIQPTETWDALRTFLTIDGEELGAFYNADTTRAGVMIVLTDGTQIFKEVDSIITDSDSDGSPTTYIYLTEAIGTEVADLNLIDYVSWVHLCRFSSDIVEFNYETNAVGNVTFTIETLERPYQDSNSEIIG